MLRVKNVTKVVNSGRNQLMILNEVNLEISPKEIISICGPSGSGKSTLLGIMSGIDQPTSGEVIINGCNIYTFDETKLARFRNENVGIVFQNNNLIPSLSVLENVQVPQYLAARGHRSSKKAKEVVDMLGIGDKVKTKIGSLSGGEQQRVAIARALIQEPQIIFADEPTGSLDYENGIKILELLKRINKECGVTIILVTHDKNIAHMTDRTIYLDQGKVHSEPDRNNRL